MIKRQELDSYLAKFLSCSNFKDYAPNGLQVEGGLEITKICTAVTASKGVIDEAIRQKASALIVHHGYFWRGEDSTIVGMKRARLASLLNAELNLFAYHLPLDCNLDLGNNACIGKLLKLENINSYPIDANQNLLWSGEFKEALSVSDLNLLFAETFQTKPLYISGVHSTGIKKLAWCSGAAQDLIERASALGVDAFMSGEISERTYYQAKELEIDYFACGHHATERYGIQALGQHLQEKFSLEHCFIDSENPI